MKLTLYLDPARVAIGLEPADKWDLLRLLVQRLTDEEDRRESILERVCEREKQLSTGLELGVAIPHGLVPGQPETHGVLAVLSQGVDFESLDGQPAHFVMLMVFPDTPEAKKTHVSLLASTIRVFSDDETRTAALAATDSAALIEVVRAAEERLGIS